MIVDDGTGVGSALAVRLRGRGDQVVRIVTAPTPSDPSDPSDPFGPDGGGRDEAHVITTDLAVAGEPARVLGRIAEQYGSVKALVHLTALGPVRGPDVAAALLPLVQGLQADLATAAARGGAAVLGATTMGGTFGLGQPNGVDDADPLDPWQGTITGFLKSLAHEWPSVRVKAVDLGPYAPAEAADLLLAELLSGDGAVEVGHRDGRRATLQLTPAPLADRTAPPPLDRDSVVLITGGARGITAETAHVLAEGYRCTLVLLGRTDPDEVEPGTDHLTDPRQLKRAIFERQQEAGTGVTPATVDREFDRIVGAREVRATLERLRATGARVAYLPCDVQDGAALTAAVRAVTETYGRIDGVIHGAGIIEDKLVEAKQPESFARVLATKAGAAQCLVDALDPTTLRFLVFYSSVSGRFGNRGQTDYAAASEVLNKLAQDLDRRWATRVVAINWGPWQAGGMMTPEVQRQFEERGIALIPIDAGRRFLDQEIRLGRKGEPEVLFGIAAARAAEASVLAQVGSTITRRIDGGAEIVRRLHPDQDRYLADHCLDGQPVLPFAVAMEHLAAAAAAARPDLRVSEISGIRVNRGVVVGDDTTIRVVATPADERPTTGTNGNGTNGNGGRTPEASFTATLTTGGARPEYTATVRLGGDLAVPVAVPLTDLAPFPMAIADAYAAYLFHGPQFQGITAIDGLDPRGADTRLRPSDVAACLRGGDGGAWLIDPVLIDCALQVQVLWARRQWDVTLLPAQIARYQRLAVPAPGTEVIRHEIRVRPDSRSPICIADHWFYAGDELVATLTGVEGVGSKALNRLASP